MKMQRGYLKMKKIKTLYVGGTFDNRGGKTSKIAETLFKNIQIANINYFNGGFFHDLQKIAEKIPKYDIVFWFPNIPNNLPKLIKKFKQKHKSFILISSKRNIDKRYSFADLLYHSLKIKSNLLLEFSNLNKKYKARLIDPLGNVFIQSSDMSYVGKIMGKRVSELLSYSRISSRKIGKKVIYKENQKFFYLVRKYASRFHKLIHPNPDSVNRFFGNASFRCERGFPSYKHKDLIFVSKRNIDKRKINKNNFIAVKIRLPVKYFGDEKPSVDTPIQIKLYKYYKNIKFILHSHTYIKNTPFTKKVIPCGAMQEVDEVIRYYPDKKEVNFRINLKGHGSLVLADNLNYLKNIDYIARPMPEYQNLYGEKNE
jgi:hypothetical protein